MRLCLQGQEPAPRPPLSVPSHCSLYWSLDPACSQLAGLPAWIQTPEQQILTHCIPSAGRAPWANVN